MYEVIDQLEGGAVIASYPTHQKALNAARRIEMDPEGEPLGYRSCTGATRDWRYLVRRKPGHASRAVRYMEAYGAGDVKIGQTTGQYPNPSALGAY